MVTEIQILCDAAAQVAAEAWEECCPTPRESLRELLSTNNPCAWLDRPIAEVLQDSKALHDMLSSLFEFLNDEELERWDENGREPDGAVALFMALVPHSSGLD